MRVQTVLIASLFLVACSPSATVSTPPEAPVATPVVVVEPVADVPFAAHGRALSRGTPRVVLVGATLRVNGAAAGDVMALQGPTLRQALAAASSQKTSGGTVELLVPPATRMGVLREILNHAAVSGHPYARILVRAPNTTEFRALDIDSMPDLADAPRELDRAAPPIASKDGPDLVGGSANGPCGSGPAASRDAATRNFTGVCERTGPRGRTLHVAAMEGNVLVAWRDGDKILAAADVSRPSEAPGGLPELAAKVAAWWGTFGQHRDASDLEYPLHEPRSLQIERAAASSRA
jgi:hypothetical protein